jgi:transposase
MSTLTEKAKVSKENLRQYLQEKELEGLWYGILMVLLGIKEASLLAYELNISRTAVYKKIGAVIQATLEVLEPVPPGRKKGPKNLEEARLAIFALKEENKALKKENKLLKKEHTLLRAAYFFLQKQHKILKEATMVELELPYTRFTAKEKAFVLELVEQFASFGGTLKEFARLTGKCYRTILSWSKVFKEQGVRGLVDNSTATSMPREIPKHIKKAVWRCHQKYPSWGGKQISFHLKNKENINVSKYQVYKILSEPKPEPEKKNRYTFGKKNMAIAMDYVELKVGELKAELLLLVDDATRMITGWKLDLTTSTAQAVEAVKDSVSKYGWMLIVKTDNGKEFRASFTEALLKLGIYHLASPYYYAQFKGNVSYCTSLVTC